jgi:K(+)-stimulated pyrophosphate-energized sodium pump
LLAAFLPSSAYAAGGENVVLQFTNTDKIYLYVSLAFGIIAIFMAFALRASVLKLSPGSEKMQEVGLAIRQGALAYLRQQVRLMLIFVVVLSVGLFALDYGKYGAQIASFTVVSFLAGVAASYIAGYTGMLTAVDGNMRTANAALTSYKQSLEVAFRSGGVAGLITVGMGLLGATMILLLAGGEAMKLLVGFGFGGSLAALFMRVGGGIFTKAADVGADLVGKVEAGIPEDDPRNPATIADNVGDNVGDCAGMAADIFESYEVTLVAAIILGAATAAIFDTTTWTRLVLFALMARGVGILASILGIFSVKGTDDIDADPLKAIRKGFYASAAVAGVLTTGLAYFMMGGSSNPIRTSVLVSVDEAKQRDRDKIVAIRDTIAKAARKDDKATNDAWKITPKQIQDDPEFKKLGISEAQAAPKIQEAISRASTSAQFPEIKKLAGFSKLDFNGNNPALKYAAIVPQTEQRQLDIDKDVVTVKDAYKDAKLVVAEIEETSTQPGAPTQRGQAPQPGKTTTRTLLVGPTTQKVLDDNFKRTVPGVTYNMKKTVPVSLYASPSGELAFAVDEALPQFADIQQIGGVFPFFFRVDPSDLRTLIKENRDLKPGSEPKPMPTQETIAVAQTEGQPVGWWLFAAAIVFGILMAFGIEALTDYYVSTHKKPTKEVAGVATAGPAPMIIQGFAYALESSVFLVFAIVFALIMPLFLFPPAQFGGYLLSFYGIALVGLGLLTTTGYVLAMDTFGPISDNAQGVYEMSGEGHDNEYGMKAVARLDAAGNTTKALTKGFAIATAVVAAVALFHTYLESARLNDIGLRLEVPEIFLGLMIGGAAPYLFSAATINAVGRAAFQLINEVRRQFRNDPGIMLGTSKPDYGNCVAIVTAAAQKELLGPGILAIALPMAVAFGFSIGSEPTKIGENYYNLKGAQALGGFLAGTIVSGQLMAVLLANAGGMWDNAKKIIEDGLHGGKGTEAHKAAVVCDTVGDPFKDTAGPALNPLIKVMNLVALLLAPTVIMPFGNTTLVSITVVSVGLLAFSIYWSKKGSLSEDMAAITAANAGTDRAVGGPSAPAVPAKKKITVEDDPEA